MHATRHDDIPEAEAMDPDERYIHHHMAQYLLRLVAEPRFPAEYLSDGDFQACASDLVSPGVARQLKGADELLMEEQTVVTRAPRHWRQRAAQRIGPRVHRLLAAVRADLAATVRRTCAGSERARMARKLERVAQVFELDAVELAIVRFYLLCALDDSLATVMQDHTLGGVHRNYPRFLAALLAVRPAQVAAALSPKGRLRSMRVLDVSEVVPKPNNPPALAETVQRIFADATLGPERVVDAFYEREPAPWLGPADFAHLAGDLALTVRLLDDAWRRRARGVNLLLYGPPGTGKTQLARLAAEQAGGHAYAPPRHGEDGDAVGPHHRRMAFDVFQRLCRGEQHPMLIIDEAEALLEGDQPLHWFGGLRSREPGDRKAWLTEALVENPLPVIWIVNDAAGIDPAVRRRFSHSVRFRALPREVMERIWAAILEGAGQRFRLDVGAVRELAAAYPLSPGHIARAVESWRAVTGRRKPDPAVLRHLLGQSLRLCEDREPGHDRLRALDARYDPHLVRLEGDADAPRLERMLRAFVQAPKGGTRDASGQLTLLFHGPSGAGKTELAKYLADRCGKLLQVERMSDLLSKWVGGSEQNIAAAFERAAGEGNFLLLDEFDSLAYDCGMAVRSWEISQTNELLQQIENFRGVLIVSTNRVDSLDPAIARRFSHKIGFGGIPAGRRADAVRAYFADWIGGAVLERDQRSRLAALASLYPGDLRAVRQRYATDALLGETPDAARIVTALEHEASFRKGERRAIGFGHGASATQTGSDS
jgi:AAA+ superfamily predicted ATPase